jgi:hypothetical protein
LGNQRTTLGKIKQRGAPREEGRLKKRQPGRPPIIWAAP